MVVGYWLVALHCKTNHLFTYLCSWRCKYMDKGNLQNDVRSVSVLNFYPLIHTFMNAQLVMRLIWWRDTTVKGAEKNTTPNVIH